MDKQDKIKLYLSFMPSECVIPARDLDAIGFFDVPASIKYHGAHEGGLFDHSFTVAKALVELTEKLGLVWERETSPYFVGMYHDLCKCDRYIKDPSGVWTYNDDIINPDHGAKSVMIAARYKRLTGEEEACIRWHMGAFETDPKMWNYYGRVIERYKNVLFTHTADMIASRILGV